jgi:hypothetical protein
MEIQNIFNPEKDPQKLQLSKRRKWLNQETKLKPG